MADDRTDVLQRALAQLQARWGDRIIAPARRADLTPLPTGFAGLDAQIGGGLWPGRMSVLLGHPTSGATSLALRALANAQHASGPVMVIDLARQFDPHLAGRIGVDIGLLVLSRPPDTGAALTIVREALGNGALGAVLLDVSEAKLSASAADVRRLSQALMGSQAALIVLAQGIPSAFDSLTDLRLCIERLAWVRQGTDVAGLTARVRIDKDHAGGGGRAVQIEVRYGEDG
ncbi:MAG: hypothetical protein H3C32_09730 [Anaerolineae bacterium]|nr:MAG: protein RecA [Chloroflexi bacterium OLB13]MBW7879582.1 hypothetical protein [Anaerolineae bacterium]